MTKWLNVSLVFLIVQTISICSGFNVVCYYGSWANYRHGDGAFKVEDMNPFLCTHFVYAFTGLNAQTSEMISLDPWLDLPDDWGLNGFGRAVQLKNINPNLKVLLAIGGWNEGSVKYSNMAADAGKRATFINSVLRFMDVYGFDGFDVDWEYPGSRGGTVADKANFILLLQELKQALHARNKILSVAVGMGVDKFDAGYDAKKISDNVDMINLMTYDFRGSFDGQTGHHTQLLKGPHDVGIQGFYNVDSSVHLWLNAGANPSKLMLGMAMYGQTFTVSSGIGPLGVPSNGPGNPGQFTQQPGFIGYNEFCLKLQSENWITETNDYVLASWSYMGNQWIAYDDLSSIKLKSQWAKDIGLGGAMIWSVETDDFHGKCGNGYFPLLSMIHSMFLNDTIPVTSDPNINLSTQSTTSKTAPSVHPTTKTTPSVHPTTKTTPSVHPTTKTTPSVHPTTKTTPSVHPTTKTTPSVHPTTKTTPSVHPTTKTTPSVHPTTKTTPSVHPTTKTTPSVHPTTKTTPSVHPTTKTTPSVHPTTKTTPSVHPTTKTTPSVHPTNPSGLTTPKFESCTVGDYKPDPLHCSKFYVCNVSNDGGRWLSKSCSASLFYNVNRYCDYEANVDCGHRPRN